MTLNSSKLSNFKVYCLVKLNDKKHSCEPNLLSKGFFTERCNHSTNKIDGEARARKKSIAKEVQTARKPSRQSLYGETDYNPRR